MWFFSSADGIEKRGEGRKETQDKEPQNSQSINSEQFKNKINGTARLAQNIPESIPHNSCPNLSVAGLAGSSRSKVIYSHMFSLAQSNALLSFKTPVWEGTRKKKRKSLALGRFQVREASSFSPRNTTVPGFNLLHVLVHIILSTAQSQNELWLHPTHPNTRYREGKPGSHLLSIWGKHRHSFRSKSDNLQSQTGSTGLSA